ncbi:MAG: choice-of-anchor J domain-containing protein [Bacteroidales bacterium]|nr:choice-of-anchor J domain-containing protein [Bacteroidales bacterium]
MLKKLVFPSLLLITVFTMIFASCVKQDFDEPPSKEIPVGEVVSIADLKAMYNGQFLKFDTAMSTYGVVVGDETSGNIYKNSYIQDATGAINLRLKNPGGLYVGDSVRVYLNGLILGNYSGVMQLDSVDVDLNIVKIKTGVLIEPTLVTIPQLAGGAYNSMLIKLEGVEFSASDTSKTWSDAVGLTTVNRTLKDCNNSTVIVRTSGYANFAGVSLPDGNGVFIGIASQFNNDIQLYVRDLNEIDLTGERCGGGGGGTGTGSGTQADPYNVVSGIEKQNATPYVVGWVKGYIVGAVKSGITSIVSNDDIDYAAPFTLATNVLIADSPTENNYLNCVIVNLPAGSPLRSEVNLLDNPDNLGKLLSVNGTLRTYFGAAGLRDSSGENADFELEGGGGGGGTSIFEEEFDSNLGTFTAYSVTGTQVWGWGNFDGGCVVMSGYQGSSFANEDWLISPAISLEGHTGVTLNFREAINYITNINDLKVLISTDYDGTSDPSTNGTWTELTGFNRAPGNNWTFVNSGDVSLAAYENQTIRIAFKFISTESGSSTWEISKVEVKK